MVGTRARGSHQQMRAGGMAAVTSRLASNPCSQAAVAQLRSWCQALPPMAKLGVFGCSLHDASHWERSGNVGMSITRQSQVVSSLTYLCVLAGDRQRLDLQ